MVSICVLVTVLCLSSVANGGVLEMGFEETEQGGFPLNFKPYFYTTKTGFISGDQKRSGEKSAYFFGSNWQLIVNYGPYSFTFLQGVTYTYDFWVWADNVDNGNDIFVRSEFCVHSNPSKSASFRGTVRVTSEKDPAAKTVKITKAQEWVKFTHTIVSAQDREHVRINVGTFTGPGQNSVKVYIDDVTLSGENIIAPTTTTISPTSSPTTITSTTHTTTTNTERQILQRNVTASQETLKNVELALIESQKNINNHVTTLNQKIDDLSTENFQLKVDNTNLENKLSDVLSRLIAVEKKLTPDGPDGRLKVPTAQVLEDCASQPCTQSIHASGDMIEVNACCAPMVINEGRCSVQPCELQNRLDALQSKLGL